MFFRRLGFLVSIGLFLVAGGVFAQTSDAVKAEIYSKLKCCACQESFAQCVCPQAKEMKAYIDALIESNVAQDEIFYKIAKKYTLNTVLDKKIKASLEARLIKEVGQKRPQIVLESSFFDFGRVSKKQGKVSRIFKLSNQGNSPLIIKHLKTSCPCALVSLKIDKRKSPYFGIEGSPKSWQSEIKPGKPAEVELVVDLPSSHVQIGKLIRDAIITSNDPLYPQITVKVEAEVSE